MIYLLIVGLVAGAALGYFLGWSSGYGEGARDERNRWLDWAHKVSNHERSFKEYPARPVIQGKFI